ncbi:MAG: hypothetical protein JW860_02560, partial [Sedimentisphaerales bacterium]|nr:hypothetical protein [Sedimentisphaerales bacterium]
MQNLKCNVCSSWLFHAVVLCLAVTWMLCGTSGCRSPMQIRQQSPNCSDLDVVLAGQHDPAFRVLLPELIFENDQKINGFCHIIPGEWSASRQKITGRINIPDTVELTVEVVKHVNEIHVALVLENISLEDLNNVWVDICTGLNHLPGNPSWCNTQFLLNLPLSRSDQGIYWYEQLAPKKLFVLTDEGWGLMHPHPNDPDSTKVPQYNFILSPQPNARACAVQSPDGKTWFYQSWRTHCYFLTPCPGNACMHLRPFVADAIKPGGSARI